MASLISRSLFSSSAACLLTTSKKALPIAVSQQCRYKHRQPDHPIWKESDLSQIFENNKKWREENLAKDPDFFNKMKSGQHPQYLVIGCSDSRVPAQEIMGLKAGEVFVTRNVANLVVNTDLSLLSVVQYAVHSLGVKDIMVFGHYGCGGVKAATQHSDHGLLEPWLHNIRDVARLHKEELDACKTEEERWNRLVELNVMEQCLNLFANPIIQRKQAEVGYPHIHGLVYNVADGHLKKLDIDFKSVVRKYRDIYQAYDFYKKVSKHQAKKDASASKWSREKEVLMAALWKRVMETTPIRGSQWVTSEDPRQEYNPDSEEQGNWSTSLVGNPLNYFRHHVTNGSPDRSPSNRRPKPKPEQIRQGILRALNKSVQDLVMDGTAHMNPSATANREEAAGSKESAPLPVAGSPPPPGCIQPTKYVIEKQAKSLKELCLTIEQACFYGVRLRDFHGVLPFWDMMEMLADRECPEARSLCAVVDKVKKNPHLRTSIGKARCFLRHALIDGCFAEIISYAISRPLDVKHFYHMESILLHHEDSQLFLSLITSLEHFTLLADADDSQLNFLPHWPLLDVHASAPAAAQRNKKGIRCVAVSSLVDQLDHWALPDGEEMIQLSKFQKQSSFNSFDKKWTQNDILLDSILHHSKLCPDAKRIVKDGVRVDQLLTIKYRLPHGSKIFGAHLSALVHDYRTCRLALIQPRLGVPIVLERMLSYLDQYVDETTPPVFSVKPGSWRVASLVRMLDESQELPSQADVPTVAAALMHFLRELPEPVLTFERYQAFLTCMSAVEKEEDRKAALKEVLHSLPMDYKASVRRLVAVLNRAWKAAGGSPTRVLEVIASEANIKPLVKTFMRSYVPAPAQGPDPKESQMVVERLITQYEVLFEEMIKEEEKCTSHVRNKLQRLAALAKRAKQSVEDHENKDKVQELLKELYHFLKRVADRRVKVHCVSQDAALNLIDDNGHVIMATAETNEEEEEEPTHADAMIDSLRWETCGFIRGYPLCEFTVHSMLSLECLVYFIRRFPKMAANMIFQYAERGRRGQHVTFMKVVSQVVRLILALLHLTPTGEARFPLQVFHKAPFWNLMDDENVVEEVFICGICLLDFLHYHEVLPLDLMPVHIIEVKRQLSWLLNLGPKDVCSMWEAFIAVQLELRRRLVASEAAAAAAEQEEGAAEMPHDESDGPDEPVLIEREPSEGVVYKLNGGVRTRLLAISDVLNDEQVGKLEQGLPESHQNYDWVQLYSLKKHGASLKTIFDRCRGSDYSILLVKDSNGAVFGGFASTQWKNRGTNYYGSGECFLFTFKTGDLVKYSWTRHNNYFMYSNKTGLAFGGGGHFGLFLDSDLQRGSSDWCKTFGSACLASDKLFDCVAVEIWAFLTPAADSFAALSQQAHMVERQPSLAESLLEGMTADDRMYLG